MDWYSHLMQEDVDNWGMDPPEPSRSRILLEFYRIREMTDLERTEKAERSKKMWERVDAEMKVMLEQVGRGRALG